MIIIHKYEIMLANGDRLYYHTEMSFNDFKNMLSENEWITIERNTWESTGTRSWSSRPPKASYQTKSIVYVDWDEEWEKEIKEREEKLQKQMPIKLEIVSYKPNIRMKWKYKWYNRVWESGNYWDEEEGFYRRLYIDKFLEELLNDYKKYKCKKIIG